MFKYKFLLSLASLLFAVTFSSLAWAKHTYETYHCNKQTCSPNQQYFLDKIGDKLTLTVKCTSASCPVIDSIDYQDTGYAACNETNPSSSTTIWLFCEATNHNQISS